MWKPIGLVCAGVVAGLVVSAVVFRDGPSPLPSDFENGPDQQALAAELRVELAAFDRRLTEMAAEIAALRLAASVSPTLSISEADLPPDLRQRMDSIRVQIAAQADAAQRTTNTAGLVLNGSPPRATERLLEAGFSQQRIDWINLRIDELTFEDSRARYEAERTGQSIGDQRTPALRLLAEMGESEYERYLTALGVPTMITVNQVLAGSPASAAGFLPGDQIITYDGKRIFFKAHLNGVLSVALQRPRT